MHIQQMHVNQDHAVPIIDLPWLFRLVRLDQAKLPNGGYRFQANLFHEKASIAVTWINSRADERLAAGCLVPPPAGQVKPSVSKGKSSLIDCCQSICQATSICLIPCRMNG